MIWITFLIWDPKCSGLCTCVTANQPSAPQKKQSTYMLYLCHVIRKALATEPS